MSKKQFRPIGGYRKMLQWLRSGLDPERVEVRLHTAATDLRWKKGGITLSCRNPAGAALKPFQARTVLVTLPVSLLKANTLRFHPEPAGRNSALQKLETGQVFKVILRFRRSFWDDEAFLKPRMAKGHPLPVTGLSFIHMEKGDIQAWWTNLPLHAPLITGWAGGPKAHSLLNEDETTRIRRSLNALSAALAAPRSFLEDQLDGYSFHDWRADPFSRGAYSYVGPGGLAAQKSLAKAIEGTLFFAGEATDPDQTGTVAGALASGHRAAREILAALQ